MSDDNTLAKKNRCFYHGCFEVKKKWQNNKNNYKDQLALLMSSLGCKNIEILSKYKERDR